MSSIFYSGDFYHRIAMSKIDPFVFSTRCIVLAHCVRDWESGENLEFNLMFCKFYSEFSPRRLIRVDKVKNAEILPVMFLISGEIFGTDK